MVLFFTRGTGRYLLSFLSFCFLILTFVKYIFFFFHFSFHFDTNKLFQIDESPLDGNVFDREALEELSKEGVTLVSRAISLLIFVSNRILYK